MRNEINNNGISDSKDVMTNFMNRLNCDEFSKDTQIQKEDGLDLTGGFISEQISTYSGLLKSDIINEVVDNEENLKEGDIVRKKDFELCRNGDMLVLRAGNTACLIRQASDDDIFFSTAEEEMVLELEAGSRNHAEWQTYLVFEDLMKLIIGRYMLNDYGKYPHLPEDFIDLENRTIRWHSDSGTDNVLKLSYSQNKINITITKEKDAARSKGNIVRIRTNGSDYGWYYQEFLEFYRKLIALEANINKKETIDNEVEDSIEKRKFLSLFKH